MAKIDVYTLGLRGVVLDKSAIHTTDGELLRAENWQIDSVGGRGGLRRRDGLAPFNAIPLAGPVLGGIGVPLPDRSALRRVFYLALNDGTHSFLVSDDGVAWSPTATFPTVPVREATLGVAGLHMVFGDAAMIWRGITGTLYYPGDDYANGGPSQPSVHAWNDQEDVAIARVPPNPADSGNTFGPFGVTSIVPYGATQLIVAVADRTSGRARVLALDVKNGALSQLGAATDLATGHIIAGIVVWQSRVWIAGVNVGAGGPLVTRWIRPGDATWTTDDTFGTTAGYCTGLCVFKGELYQGTAADAGSSGLIRRRRQAAGGSATRTTSVLGGSTSVAIGGNTTVVGAVAAGASVVPVADIAMLLLDAGAAYVSGQGINYTGRTRTPMAAPTVVAAPGTGLLAVGVYQYAITWRTPAGESLPSPGVSVMVGVVVPPASPPIVGAAALGGRLDTGTHDYVQTFVTASGETTPSPISAAVAAGTVIVGGVAAPASAPSVGAAQPGGSMDVGSHDYVLTFLTASGETTPSPISGAVAMSVVTSGGVSPPSAPSVGTPVAGAGPEPGQHAYLATFVNNVGETTAGNSSGAVTAAVTTPISPPSSALSGVAEAGGAGSFPPNTSVNLLYTFQGTVGETTGSPSMSVMTLSVASYIHLTNIPAGPPGTFARKIYHFVNGAYRYASSYDNATLSAYLYSPASGNAAIVPSSNTASVPVAHHQIPVSVPTGPAGVIARRLYRSFNGGSFALVTTLNDNATVNYSDNVPNGSRGGTPPTTNTTGTVTQYGQVQITGLAVGPPAVLARNLYRRFNGAGSFRLLATLAATGSTFQDASANAALAGTPPPPTNTTGTPTVYAQVNVSGLLIGPAGVLGRNLYRRFNGVGAFLLLAALGPSDTTYLDANSNATLVGRPVAPTVNTTAAHQVNMTGIPIGPPGTTNRWIYRTPANGSVFHLLTYFDDNTSTAFVDVYDDSYLLAVFLPTVDTSGLPAPGVLTGVTGLSAALVNGAPITPALPVGATTLPVADLAALLAPGAVNVAGQVLYYTGRSAASGPGSLTGVTGIAAVIPHGAAVVLTVPAGATAVPVGDTTNFSSLGGNALVGAQPITYTGRSTTSGPGVLTGVAGLAGPAFVGTAVSVLVAPAAVWSTVYASGGTAAGNSVGPFIVTADGGVILAFCNATGANTPSPIVILQSVDGVLWNPAYYVTVGLGSTYGRSGMPLLDPDTGDIYWPLASGSSGSGSGGLLKRTAVGGWSVVLRGLTNVRGPLGIVRVAVGE